MIIHTTRFATSRGDHDDQGLTFVYCTDTSGYCLSLSRFLDDELVEVMVLDQINHKTREVAVVLAREELKVSLSRAAAARLDGITEYTVPLALAEDQLRDLDATLSVIFEGGSRGRYESRPFSGSERA
jgi:hypothetical protein